MVCVRYTYVTAEKLGEYSYWGRLAWYYGGGYIQVLPNTSATLQQVLVQLQTDQWIDHGTRAVFIDFTTYNPNDNLFAVVRSGVKNFVFPVAVRTNLIQVLVCIRLVAA